jgi:glutamine amidotransferase
VIAIIDYRAGNLTSVRLAFGTLGVEVQVTQSPQAVLEADRIVFPGVGAAAAAMATLGSLGLTDAIRTVVARRTPFLGICLGTQIILQHSDEDGGVAGIGLVAGDVRQFAPPDRRVKVPHMGWNNVRQAQRHAVFDGIRDQSEFYFVHSYYPVPADPRCVLGTTEYAGVTFASVLGGGSMVATQFHPEKSGRVGLRFLRNFLDWRPGHTAPGPDAGRPNGPEPTGGTQPTGGRC